MDAGEIGAGHQVTALYEIVPNDVEPPASLKMEPASKYQRKAKPEMEIVPSEELATFKFRYKPPTSDTSIPLSLPIMPQEQDWSQTSDDFKFSAAVGLFGMLLRENELSGEGEMADVVEMAHEGTGKDPFGRRKEFIEIADRLRQRN